MNEMNINNYSVLVLGCRKHEQIAKKYFELAKLFWKESLTDTIFCTDITTDFQKTFGTEIAIGDDAFTYKSRIINGILKSKNDYIFLLLDDYFITKHLDNNKMKTLIEESKKNDVVYCRLVGIPKLFIRYKGLKGAKKIRKHTHYGVNLQPSFWKKEELLKFLLQINGVSAWEVEIEMRQFQLQHYNKCISFNKNILSYKNGVLRGQLFPYTNKLLVSNDLAPLEISTISRFKYYSFLFKQRASHLVPSFLRKLFKKIGRTFGKKYYTDD